MSNYREVLVAYKTLECNRETIFGAIDRLLKYQYNFLEILEIPSICGYLFIAHTKTIFDVTKLGADIRSIPGLWEVQILTRDQMGEGIFLHYLIDTTKTNDWSDKHPLPIEIKN